MTQVAIVAIIVPVLLLLCIFVIVVLVIVRRRRISRNNRGRQRQLPASQEQPPNSVQLEEIGVDNQYAELNIERPPEDNYYQSLNPYQVVE